MKGLRIRRQLKGQELNIEIVSLSSCFKPGETVNTTKQLETIIINVTAVYSGERERENTC